MITTKVHTNLSPTVALGGDCFDMAAWLNQAGNFEHAIAYARLCWPKFKFHEGCVLFADIDEQSYQTWLGVFHGNKTLTQAVLNHRHLLELFPDGQEPSHSRLIYLGQKLKASWETKLALDFPHRGVTVALLDGADQGVDDSFAHMITFFIPCAADAERSRGDNRQAVFLGACHPRAHL